MKNKFCEIISKVSTKYNCGIIFDTCTVEIKKTGKTGTYLGTIGIRDNFKIESDSFEEIGLIFTLPEQLPKYKQPSIELVFSNEELENGSYGDIIVLTNDEYILRLDPSAITQIHNFSKMIE